MTKADETAAKMAVVQSLLGKTAGKSKGSKPPPDPKLQILPTGGLIPDGLKAKLTFKF